MDLECFHVLRSTDMVGNAECTKMSLSSVPGSMLNLTALKILP